MDNKELLKELLNIIDIQIIAIDDEEIIIKDLLNDNHYNYQIKLPISFYTKDTTRTFNCSKLNKDTHNILIQTTINNNVEKNGIGSIEFKSRKENRDNYFSYNYYNEYNETMYESSTGYMFGDIYTNYNICKLLDNDNMIRRSIEYRSSLLERFLYFKNSDTEITITDEISHDEHNGIIRITKQNEIIYEEELSNEELLNRFNGLLFRIKDLVIDSRNGINKLSNTLLDIAMKDKKIDEEFISIINNSKKNNELDELLKTYFNNENNKVKVLR